MQAGANTAHVRGQRRPLTVLLVLLALLVVLVGSGGLFYSATAAATMVTGPAARARVNGLVLSLQVAPGPYFLGELLPFGVALTNRTTTTVHVEGRAGAQICGAAFNVTVAGGSAPTYPLPTTGFISCPGPFPTDLPPGQTMSTTGLLPLTASGHLTLTAQVRTVTVVTAASGQINWVGLDPFVGHEPAVDLMVAAATPPNRAIRLWRTGTRVFIIAPPQAMAHLVYMYAVRAGGCGTGNFIWEPIVLPSIEEGVCAGRYGTWSYAVGAPGYAVATGSMTTA